jgi:hypothetical protein
MSSPTPATLTVPAGKVWKIEQACLYVNQTNYYYTSASTYSLYANNILLFSMRSASPQFNGCPVWLPAGTYTLRISNENGSTFTYKGAVNAVEFNIIP